MAIIRPRSSMKGVASFMALKVPVYSRCQHRPHRAQPRHTRSAARSKTTAGFSSLVLGTRPMLSYSSRSAPAAFVSRSLSCCPAEVALAASCRFTRFPPNSRPGRSRNSPAPRAASSTNGAARGSVTGSKLTRDAARKASAASPRRRDAHFPASSPARPNPAANTPLPVPAHRSAVRPRPSPAAAPVTVPRS